jgi:hypothetical protein
MLFLDPHTRDLHRHWPEEAKRAVASLRVVAGRFPDDRELTDLVGELSVRARNSRRCGPSIRSRTAFPERSSFAILRSGTLPSSSRRCTSQTTPVNASFTYTTALDTASDGALQLLRAVVRADGAAPGR